MNEIIQYGENMNIEIETENAHSLLYFLVDGKGEIQAEEKIKIKENISVIKISPNLTKNLQIGANSIKIFVISDKVLKSDFYESSFLVTENNVDLPMTAIKRTNMENQINYDLLVIPIIVIVIIAITTIYVKIKYQSKL